MSQPPIRRDLPTREMRVADPTAIAILEENTDAAIATEFLLTPDQSILKPAGFFRRIFTWESLVIVLLLIVCAATHGYNMFHYPYFENDEGTYMSQAWAVVAKGQLAPYTYWYDHAPLGWIFIAFWSVVTGGFNTFGSGLYSGRIFMLVLDMVTVVLLYRIIRIISGNMLGAAIAVLIYLISPLAIYYHRRVLLDNIMTFWVMISLTFIVGVKRLQLHSVWLSAIAFGIAIITKENAIFFLPTLPMLVWYRSHKVHRGLSFFGWTLLALLVVSLYFLYATLKGELFPPGVLPWDHANHVSLLGSLHYQSGRENDGGIRNFSSDFWRNVIAWVIQDPILTVGGTVCAFLSLFVFRTNRLVGILGLGNLLMWLFIARGGVVLGFYIIPQLPLFAINIGLIVAILLNRIHYTALKHHMKTISRYALSSVVLISILGVLIIGSFATSPSHGTNYPSEYNNLFFNQQATAQMQALNWIFQNAPPGSAIMTDDYAQPDLELANRHYIVLWYWKVAEDPAIRDTLLHNDWNNVDYIISTGQLVFDMSSGFSPLLNAIYQHATPIITFDTGFSNASWPVTIYKINHLPHPQNSQSPGGGSTAP